LHVSMTSYSEVFRSIDIGVLAYTDANGQLSPDFHNALGMYCWAWFILTVIFTIAAMRSSWVLWATLFFLDIELILLACGYMLNSSTTLVAANSVGFVVAFCACKSSTVLGIAFPVLVL
jgi:succinate-acetate transporter protein